MNGNAEMTVSELNQTVTEAIRKDLRLRCVSVRGEISGFKHHIASGHWYFVLKDENASVNCVMFRQNTFRSEIRPKDGAFAVVTGYVDTYPRTGTYQLYAQGLRAAGLGDLYQRFEALKQKLLSEGLFDPQRKKPLPMVPRKVAVVTSESGAALQDILNVSRMRNPSIPIVLIPTSVQGKGAAEEIAAAIRRANRLSGADVMIVGRGGGSVEDLWCFNEEIVARAVAESRIPIVSGVGHETDLTICDLAADMRASTPSNAAEIVFPEREELSRRIRLLRTELFRAGTETMRSLERRTGEMKLRLSALSPERRLAAIGGRVNILKERLSRVTEIRTERLSLSLRQSREAFPGVILRRIEKEATRLRATRDRMEAVNPLRVLDRGYALVYAEGERMIKTAAEARREETLRIRFADGWLMADRRRETDGE